jgi:hypothetical protein
MVKPGLLGCMKALCKIVQGCLAPWQIDSIRGYLVRIIEELLAAMARYEEDSLFTIPKDAYMLHFKTCTSTINRRARHQYAF